MSNVPASSGDELREKLAAIEHKRWADWQKWMHKCMTKEVNYEGKSVYTLSEEQFLRWEKQIRTNYPDLSETEKQSDREQVDRYWPLIEALLAQADRSARIDVLGKVKIVYYGGNTQPEVFIDNEPFHKYLAQLRNPGGGKGSDE